MPRFESPSHWTPDLVRERIDRVLLTDQYIKLSEEMNKGRYKAKAEKGYKLANAWVLLAEDWAEKMFAAYIEIWDLQGFPRCDAIYTAAGDAINQGFAGHCSAFTGRLDQLALVNHRHVDSETINLFKARMNALAGKWKRRIDVEERKAMYAARQEQPTPNTTQATSALFLEAPQAEDQVLAKKMNRQDAGQSKAVEKARPQREARQSLLEQIRSAPQGYDFKASRAAIALDVSIRTVQRRVKDGLLTQGAKPGTVSASSLRRHLRMKRPSAESPGHESS